MKHMLALKSPIPEGAHVTSAHILVAKEVTWPRLPSGIQGSAFLWQDRALNVGEQKCGLPRGHKNEPSPCLWSPRPSIIVIMKYTVKGFRAD